MKNKAAKSLIIFLALSLVIIIMFVCLCACNNDDGEDLPPKQEYPCYDKFEGSYLVRIDAARINTTSKCEVVKSLSDMEKFKIFDSYYSEEYFEKNVILLINFKFSSSDENREFKNLAIKDGKFYPIFEVDGRLSDESSCDDENNNLYIVECRKDILAYEFADILIINRRDYNLGSYYYKSIKTVFN